MIDLTNPKIRKFAAWGLGITVVLVVLGYLTADQLMALWGRVLA